MTYYDRAAEAVRLRSEGHSLRSIGRLLGAGKSTVQRWLAAAPAPEPEAPTPPPPAPADAKGVIGEVQRASELVHERALAEHDPAVAGRAVVDLASATAIGARADKVEVQPGVWMTPAEIRSEVQAIYARAAELAAEAGPAHCEGCGCELTLPAMGSDLPPIDEASPAPEQGNPALDRARQTFARASQAVDQALEDGHLRAAQRANRQRTDIARVIVREERIERERRASGSVFFPAADTAARIDELKARSAILADAPLTCGPCGAQLRMAQVVGAVSAAP